MNRTKLTAEAIRRLEVTGQAYTVTDTLVAALSVYVAPSGRKVFRVRFRPVAGGKQTLITLGEVGAMSVAEARTKATEEIAKGRASPVTTLSTQTWGDALDTVERLLKGGGKAEVMRTLRRETAPWSTRRLRTITTADVRAILNAIEDRGSPVQRNRTLAYIKLAFGRLVERGDVGENPATGIKKLAEDARDRYLGVEEVVAVWRAAETIRGRAAGIFTDVLQLLILTGCRHSEVAGARVEEVDIGANLWTIPASRMKAGKAHEVPLSPMAAAIMTRRVTEANAAGRSLLFTTTGTTPTVIGTKIKAEIDKALGTAFAPWRVHDLRHGVRSGLSALGVAPHVAERVLAHLPAGIAGRYDHHAFREEKRAALAAWSARLNEEIDPAIRKAKALAALKEMMAQP